MRNNFVRTLALVGMVGMMSTTGLVAHAAEAPQAAQTQTAKQNLNASVIAKVFDAKYYAEAYPDVVAVLGNDPAKLLNHYINSGIYEGRDASATFNASVYALANSDIAAVYGDNLESYVEHYLAFGAKETESLVMSRWLSLILILRQRLQVRVLQCLKLRAYQLSHLLQHTLARLHRLHFGMATS